METIHKVTFKLHWLHPGIEFEFSAVPPERIRQILKANGFRWNPLRGVWHRRHAKDVAGISEAIDKILDPPTCRESTPCWACKAPGMLRNHGATAPVLCDECEAKDRQHQHELRYGQ